MPSEVGSNRTSPGLDDRRYSDSPLEHVRTIYVGFFQRIFGSLPVGEYRWQPGSGPGSEIQISDESPVDGSKIGYRPAITFTRGPLQFHSQWFGDVMKRDLQTGAVTKSALWPSSMSINFISRSQLESERLAMWGAEQLWAHIEYFTKQIGMYDVSRQIGVGSPSAAGSLVANDSGDEWYATSVLSPFVMYRTTKITPLGAPISGEVSVNMNYRYSRVKNGPDWPIQTHDVPIQIHSCAPDAFSPASDASGRSPDPGENTTNYLPKETSPTNPARTTVVRTVRPIPTRVGRRGVAPTSVPFDSCDMEESTAQVQGTVGLKIR